MKDKLVSRKFWVTIFSLAISIVSVFTELGGSIGTIFGIIGIILSSISYVFIEGKIDAERIKL